MLVVIFFGRLKMKFMEWVCRLNLGSFVCKYRGSSPGFTGYLGWSGSQWHDSIRSARDDPALNGYLESSGGR